MISAVVRGTEQKLTISLCLLDNDTFLVSECLSRVSESWTWLLFSSTSLLSSSTSLLFCSTWLPTWLLFPSTWLLFFSTSLLSSLQTVMTNSCALSLFINVTLTSSSRARVMPLPTPVYGSKYIALLKRNILRGMEVPALISSIVSPLGNAPGL